MGAGDLRVLQGASSMLTTVRQDFNAMAKKALDVLLNRIEGHLQEGDWQHEVLDVELAIRQSCGAKLISPSNRIEEAGA